MSKRLLPGQLLVEAIVAIGLLAIFAATLFVSFGSQYLSTSGTQLSISALSLAQEGLDASRAIRDSGWLSLATGTHGLVYQNSVWSFQSTSDTNGGYTRTITVTNTSSTNERQVVSTVTWRDATQQLRTTTLVTNMSNWRNVTNPPRLSGDWKNPQTLGTIDLGPGNQATGVAVRNGIVYMSALASNASKPDFYVINAQNPQTPSILGSVDTGPGLSGLALSGSFAYVANTDGTNQLQIINISTTSSPQAIKSFLLTGNNEPALSIAASGTLVLVGTQNDLGPELYLVDVTNPASPQIRSTIEIGGDVNGITIIQNRAYLATSNNAKEFMVVDISNPNSPVVKASIALPGTNAALSVFVNDQDSRAYIVRKNGSGTSPEVNIYNVFNPDAPVLLGSMEFGSDVPAVFAADNLMFLGTALSNLEFQIFEVTDPQNMVYYSGLNFPQVAADIAFENNILYIAVRSNDALRIVTSQ